MTGNVEIRRDERGRALELPPAMVATRWQKGIAPNPSGKGGLYHECLKLYRDKSPEAAKRLCELVHSDDERVAFMASDKVMERAWGKAKEYDPKADAPALSFDPATLTPDELTMLKAAMLVLAKAAARQAETPHSDGT